MTEKTTHRRTLSFWDHVAMLIKWRWLVMIYMAVMLVAAVSYALLTQEWYRSYARLLPPPSNTFGLGNMIPGLAQGALGLGGLLSDEVNLVISVLESRDLADRVIDHFNWKEVYEIEAQEEAYEQFAELVSYEYDERGMIMISAEAMTAIEAQETVNYIVEVVRNQYNQITRSQARSQRDFIGRRLDQNYADLAAAEDSLQQFQKETGVLNFEDQAAASVEAVAEIYQQLALAEVELEVIKASMPEDASPVISLKREVTALQKKIDQMTSAQDTLASKLFINFDLAPEHAIQYLRLMREVEIQNTILEFLLPQYEQARIMEMREDANIYVLDWGNVPEKRARPRRTFVVLAWLFGAFIILYPILIFFEWMNRMSHDDPERYRKINSTLTMLKPNRFFSRKPTAGTE